jgi:flagellar basal body-associated protein FliL
MAEEPVDPQESAEGGESPSGGKKRKLLLGGGAVAVMAFGGIAAMMAIPSREAEARRLAGPYSIALFDEEFTCNIAEPGHSRFLRFSPQAAYFAYEPTYLQERSLDELYAPALRNTVLQISSRKTVDEIYGDTNENTFMAELRDALDPVLFPVHIGRTKLPWDFDEATGLRPGLSSDLSTFRGEFDEHVLNIDEPAGEMWIDEGPRTSFEPGDYDVRVIDADGRVVFIDTSNLEEGFQGHVNIGVRGRIRTILPGELLIQ